MEHIIKYFAHPTFKEADLAARNPYIEKGEIIFTEDLVGNVNKFKVGPGFWNDLSYFSFSGQFPINENVTNPIGDAKGNLYGQSEMQILQKMLFPYQVPGVATFQNNAGGSFSNVRTIEIGSIITGPIQVIYTVNNSQNLLGATPIIINASGLFSNEGTFANLGSHALNLVAPLNPSVPTTYTINILLTHQNGTTPAVTSRMQFFPKIVWGVSSSATINAGVLNALISRQTLVSNSYKRDYNFTGQGYSVVAIPTMLAPSNMVFTDVTNPNLPAGFSMEDLGVLSYNNGVGTYNYQIFRSTYFITESSSILRIS